MAAAPPLLVALLGGLLAAGGLLTLWATGSLHYAVLPPTRAAGQRQLTLGSPPSQYAAAAASKAATDEADQSVTLLRLARAPASEVGLAQLLLSDSGYDPAGAIPRRLHQSYMGGREELYETALRRESAFRKHWWLSCKVLNPEYEYHLWDEPAAIALLQERYPWFLPIFLAYDTVVLRADALRPFVLHAYGGVYLDLDTECFAPLDASLAGHQAVLMAEEPSLCNNAQMASVPGHPLWVQAAARLVRNALAGVKDPLHATGPHVITASLTAWTEGRAGGSRLPGTHRGPDGSSIRVWGPQSWFTPCSWNDWDCHLLVARNPTSVHRLFPQCVGIHHFSGSWLASADQGRSAWLMQQGAPAVVEFLADADSFVQQDACLNSSSALLMISGNDGGAACEDRQHLSFDICWDALRPDLQAGTCTILSVRDQAAETDQQQAQSEPRVESVSSFCFENQLARLGCSVRLFVPRQLDPSAALHERVTYHAATLGLVDDPLGEVPMMTLQTILQQQDAAAAGSGQEQEGGSSAGSLTALNLQCASSDCDAWAVINQLHREEQALLQRVSGLLLLEMDGAPPARHSHQALSLYQHLYKELGFRGYAHHRVEGTTKLRLAFTRHHLSGQNSSQAGQMMRAR